MPGDLHYQERLPPATYAPWVACCWQSRGVAEASGAAHRVLPDGCADLLINLGSGTAGAGRAAVVGPMQAAALVPLVGPVDLLGVRFRPGAFSALVRTSLREIADLAVSPRDLALALDLPLERLAATPSLAGRAALLLAALRPRFADARPHDAAVAHALARWRNADAVPMEGAARPRDAGTLALATVAVLARDLGLSERSFERRFAARVGYAPAQFRRLARFRRVLQLHAAGRRDWAGLAADCGYTDQSHLVRDFRAFAGVSPGAWAREQALVGIVQDVVAIVD